MEMPEFAVENHAEPAIPEGMRCRAEIHIVDFGCVKQAAQVYTHVLPAPVISQGYEVAVGVDDVTMIFLSQS